MSRTLTGWARDERGGTAVELIVSLPLLVGMMLITANYGLLLNSREALDSATRDAARILARAPAWCVADGSADNPIGVKPAPHAHFLDEARQMIADRMAVDLAAVTILDYYPTDDQQTVFIEFVAGGESLASGHYFQMVLEVEVEMDRFLLLNRFLGDAPLSAAESARWFSDSPFHDPDAIDAGTNPNGCVLACTIAERNAGTRRECR